MDSILLSQGLPSGLSADSALDQSSCFLTTVIRRDQMPEDLRSEFLPQDIILINEPRGTDSIVSQTLVQARRRLAAGNLECLWCRAHDVCNRLILALVGLIIFGASVVLTSPSLAALALFAVGQVMTRSRSHTELESLAPAFRRPRAETRHRVGRSCSRDVKKHRLASLARCILSPSSILLLQQPALNIRSFIRYHQFFTGARGKAGRVVQQEVDSCIRHYAAQGVLPIEALAASGTKALLGLEPCREEFACFGHCLSWPTILHQNYRDWKRWRLAIVVCERIQAGESSSLPLSITDGHDPLDELEGRGDHKWFLVSPKLFSSKVRRRLGAQTSVPRNVSKS